MDAKELYSGLKECGWNVNKFTDKQMSLIDNVMDIVEAKPLADVRLSLLGYDSTKLIGNVHEHYKNVFNKDRRWNVWRAFYNGWLDGRAKMLQEIKSNEA